MKALMFWMILTGVLLWNAPLTAQSGYPTYDELYVHDYAGLLSASTANYLRETLVQLNQETGIEMAVVTIGSIHDYDTGDATIESFATNLFNAWGIGSAEHNNGILILVAVNDREVKIEVGTTYESSLNAAMQSVIDENMLPRFRDGDYDGGIYSGARAAIHALTGEWPAESSQPAFSPTRVPASGTSGTSPVSSEASGEGINPLVVLGGGGLLLGGAGVGFQRFMRYRKRRCPSCGTLMDRLDEAADDAHLSEGERREEALGAVDYDVWQCPGCGTRQSFPYSRWFSPYSSCPQCHYRTITISRHTLRQPTYTSTGEREVRRTCNHCSFRDSYSEVIPVRTRATSSHSSFGGSSRSGGSSRGSYGGGRSSGGGAKGKW